MESVRIHGVNKYFGKNYVIKNLSLEIPPGSFTILLGPSGCGKSTLLNCIAGLEDIDSGNIYIGNRDVTYLEPRDRGVAMVFQSYALYPTMTVEENLSFSLRMAHVAKTKIREKVSNAAQLLHISSLLKSKPAHLSGGQKQRVAIGRALVRDVKIFLFDEPLSNLDAKLRVEMRAELKRLHDRLGHTTIYVTHDQVEAMTMATQIAVMRDGVIQQVADPQTLYDKPDTLFVAGFIGSPSMNFLAGTVTSKNNRLGAQVGQYLLPLDNYPFRSPVNEGKQVIIGIRPENVKRLYGPSEQFAIELPSDVTEPMGSDTLVLFKFGADYLTARLSPQNAGDIRPGEVVRLGIDLSTISVFDRETEQRL